MSSKASIDVEIQFKATVVRPGDTLVLVARQDIDQAQQDNLRKGIEEHLPGVRAVVVQGVEQAVVYQPEGIVHRSPPRAEALTPCCGRTPFELPRSDRMAVDSALVTCRSGPPCNRCGAPSVILEGTNGTWGCGCDPDAVPPPCGVPSEPVTMGSS